MSFVKYYFYLDLDRTYRPGGEAGGKGKISPGLPLPASRREKEKPSIKRAVVVWVCLICFVGSQRHSEAVMWLSLDQLLLETHLLWKSVEEVRLDATGDVCVHLPVVWHLLLYLLIDILKEFAN